MTTTINYLSSLSSSQLQISLQLITYHHHHHHYQVEALEAPTLSVSEAASSSYADVISMYPPNGDALSELRRGSSEFERMPYSVMAPDEYIDGRSNGGDGSSYSSSGDDPFINSSVAKEQLKLSGKLS